MHINLIWQAIFEKDKFWKSKLNFVRWNVFLDKKFSSVFLRDTLNAQVVHLFAKKDLWWFWWTLIVYTQCESDFGSMFFLNNASWNYNRTWITSKIRKVSVNEKNKRNQYDVLCAALQCDQMKWNIIFHWKLNVSKRFITLAIAVRKSQQTTKTHQVVHQLAMQNPPIRRRVGAHIKR